MPADTPQWLFYALLFVQLAGLATAWLTRLSCDGPHVIPCQWAFYFALVGVGAVAITGIELGPIYVLSSGTTLALMAVAATSSRRGIAVL